MSDDFYIGDLGDEDDGTVTIEVIQKDGSYCIPVPRQSFIIALRSHREWQKQIAKYE